MRYVIAYDVSDDGRRSRLARFLEGWGRRVQKSVFECDLSADELRRVHRRISELIEVSEDRCHIYRLCGECVPERLVLGSELELQLEGPIVL